MDNVQKNKHTYNVLPDYISITIIKNVRELLHPNKMNTMDLESYLDDLLDKSNPVEPVPKILDFFENLHDFCQKIVNYIMTTNTLSSSNNSSISTITSI